MRQRSISIFCKRLPEFASLIDCWPIQTRRKDGYATFGDRSVFSELYAHRIVWNEVFGPIPVGWEVDHACHTRNCVNPLHLRACPLAENRRWAPWGKATECPHGHTKADNKAGRLFCPECTRLATRSWLSKDNNRERQNELRKKRRQRTGK